MDDHDVGLEAGALECVHRSRDRFAAHQLGLQFGHRAGQRVLHLRGRQRALAVQQVAHARHRLGRLVDAERDDFVAARGQRGADVPELAGKILVDE